MVNISFYLLQARQIGYKQELEQMSKDAAERAIKDAKEIERVKDILTAYVVNINPGTLTAPFESSYSPYHICGLLFHVFL